MKLNGFENMIERFIAYEDMAMNGIIPWDCLKKFRFRLSVKC